MSSDLDRILKKIDAGHVLDVATGIGEFINTIQDFRSYASIQAIDLTPGYETILKEQFPEEDLTFTTMDAVKMSFKDNSFDTVCMSNSLHHMKNPGLVLNEMKRVCKPGGYLIINEMVAEQLIPAQESHRDLHHWSAKRDRFMGIYHRPTYTLDKLEKILAIPGLSTVEKLMYFHEFEDPKSPDLVQDVLAKLDHIAERMNADGIPQYIIDEGAKIRKYILEHGFASSFTMFAWLQLEN